MWPILAALPWLLPTHSDPWTTFYGEWLMAAALLPVAAWAAWRIRARWQIDTPTAALALIAVVPLAQAATGMLALPGESWLIAAYLCGMALTMSLAQRVQSAAPLRLPDALFASFTIAGLASVGLALCQWLGLETFSLLLVESAQGTRPAANLGQPNNLSTLLVWALVSIWWSHWRGNIGGRVASFAAAFLLLGVALTQSRTGVLAVVMLAATAVVAHRPLGTRAQAAAFVALALWFALIVAALDPVSRMLMQAGPALSLEQQANPGKRPMIWAMALQAIAMRPWAGWGWYQSVQANVVLADQYPLLQVTVAHAHNIVLDLILWCGAPLAGAMLLGLARLARHHLRGPLEAPQVLLLLALAVFVLHAMLELPHVYAFFLLPAAVMLGTLGGLRPTRHWVPVPRAVMGALVAACAVLLAAMFTDYTRIEADATAFRFREARIGSRAPPRAPDIWVLQSLQSAMTTFREEPSRGMSRARLDDWRRIVGRYPTRFGLFRYAQASALNGQPDQARWALQLLCALNSANVCLQTGADWMTIATLGHFQEMADLSPPWH